MSDIFTRLGLDPEGIDRWTKALREKYDEEKDSKRHKTAGYYGGEIKKLAAALEDLSEVLAGLDKEVTRAITYAYPEGDCPLSKLRRALFQLRGFEPLDLGGFELHINVPRNRDIARNLFIWRVANFYLDKTGKEPTTVVDPYNENKRGGAFADFLVAVAERAGIETRGIIRQAAELRQQGDI